MSANITVARGFFLGAIVGDLLAILFILLDWLRPLSVAGNAWVDRVTFKICPFYALGFANSIGGWASLMGICLIGNAVLYGAPIAFLVALLKLSRVAK